MSRMPELQRQVFTTSRELEYFSESELTTQTGYPKEDWWPGVVVKELIDNSLDACEQAGVAPEIGIELGGDSLTVWDNGPGIPAEVVGKILDFSSRTSDKAAYVAPTRGCQGNALKTIAAIPYVLNGGKAGVLEIEACGTRHAITVSTDQIARRPQVEHRTEEIVKSGGTRVHVRVDLACLNGDSRDLQFLQKLVVNYALFNPHASFELAEHGRKQCFEATRPGWRKWLPGDPTSAHWYNAERLGGLIGCYLSAEREGGRVRTVREFICEFRGLSATAKQKRVTERAGLERLYLHNLVGDGKLDAEALDRLLRAMQELSAPVKPEALGVLGEEHFKQLINAQGKTFRYKREKGIDAGGLPFVVEFAFGMTDDERLQGQHIGLNWSVPLSNPLQDNRFDLGDDGDAFGLAALFARHRIHEQDPVCMCLHLISPRFDFLDRGKGSVKL